VYCAQVIAFFVTARLTQFYSEFFDAMGLPVLEIHSRKSQSARTKASDAFRAGGRVRPTL
jgi:ATP-dependent RNA helicase MSS116, mitochondrial